MIIHIPKNLFALLVVAAVIALNCGAYLVGVWHADTLQVSLSQNHAAHMQIIDTRLKAVEVHVSVDAPGG